jgi:type I site-specific restriction endonuclease
VKRRAKGKIVERFYQTRAIRRIGEAFERDRERKALVVMATGTGKTRTVIALCDVLMRCNWVKRVLFLADRVALVNQAVGAFKRLSNRELGSYESGDKMFLLSRGDRKVHRSAGCKNCWVSLIAGAIT